LRLPARFMLAPMIGSAIVHMAGWTDFRLPVELIALAQIVIGTTIGARFAGMDRRLILKMLGVSVIAAAILLGTAAVFATAVSLVTDNHMDALLLAYAPGGLAEMSLVALALNIDIAFVVLHHVVRVLLVVSTATVAFDLIFGRKKAKE
jgi:membrane AbrB-like protein